MTGQFLPLEIDVRDNLDGTWTLLQPLTYVASDGTNYHVPAGFVTDFGSIPEILWEIPALVPNGSAADPAYVLHDYLYTLHHKGIGLMTRKQADDLLLEALAVCGVNWLRRYTIYSGVRMGGWAAWNKT